MAKSNTSQHQIIPTQKALFVYGLAAFFLCLEMALQISPGVMTPELKSDLSLTNFSLGVISGVYFITYTIMQIPSGMMYDRQNICKILTTAIFLCALGALAFGLSENAITAGLARLFMGFGSAFAFISVLTVSARYFPSRHFALLTGIAQLLAAIGGMAGEIPIAYLVQELSWRTTMVIFAAVGFVLMLLVLWVFNDLPDKAQPQNKDCIDNSDPRCGLLYNLLKLAKSPQHWFAFSYAFFNWAPIIAFAELWGVPFLKESYALSTQQAAGLCALIWLGLGLTSPVIGALSDIIKRRNILLCITALIGGVSIYFVIYTHIHSYALLAFLLFLTGVGSAGQILSFAVVKDNTPHKRISTAIGLNNVGVVASGIIFQPLIGKLMMIFEKHAGISQTQVFQKALAIVPISFFICVLITIFLIKETRCKEQF
jgi:MFS family permease